METSVSTTRERGASRHEWLAPEAPDLVWFSGEDAVRFLNDIISQEIADLAPGEVRRSLLLGPQGKLDHMLWVTRSDERIGLITDAGRGEELATTLGRYRIRVDVDITVEGQSTWLVMGEWDGIDVSWEGVTRTLVVGDRPDLPDGTMHDYEAARIREGEPRWGAEVSGTTTPHETGLIPVSVAFDKGCFLGQELVARVDSRGGNAPRFVRLIELADDAAAGTTLTVDESEVGTLTSVSDRFGLGVVHRTVEPGSTVEVGSTTGVVREVPQKPQT